MKKSGFTVLLTITLLSQFASAANSFTSFLTKIRSNQTLLLVLILEICAILTAILIIFIIRIKKKHKTLMDENPNLQAEISNSEKPVYEKPIYSETRISP